MLHRSDVPPVDEVLAETTSPGEVRTVRFTLVAREELDADLARIRSEQLVVLELSELADLVCEPDGDPLTGRGGPERAGMEDIAATLTAARRLPDDLTVRVVLPEGAAIRPAVTEAEASLHHRAR